MAESMTPLQKIVQKTNQGSAAVVVRVRNWNVQINASGRSGWLIPDFKQPAPEPRSQSWIRYDDGRVAFDFPNEVPQYIKNWLSR